MNPSAYETQTEPDCGSDPQGLEWAKEQLLDPAHLCCGHGQDSGFSPLSSGSLAGQREEQDTDFKVKRKKDQPGFPPASCEADSSCPVQDQRSSTALDLHQMHI